MMDKSCFLKFTYTPRRSVCPAPPPASFSGRRSPASDWPGFLPSAAPDRPSGPGEDGSSTGEHRDTAAEHRRGSDVMGGLVGQRGQEGEVSYWRALTGDEEL